MPTNGIPCKHGHPGGALGSGALPDASPGHFDKKEFRHCLGEYATGVAIVATEHDGNRAGVTVNSFTSLSLSPPLILWCIGRTSRSFDIFLQAKTFSVSILASHQIAVSRTFSSDIADKFARIDWRHGATGAPIITGAAAHFDCTTHCTYDGGDHVIIVGRVERFARTDSKGLVFAKGQYAVSTDFPDSWISPPPIADGSLKAQSSGEEEPLFTVLAKVNLQLERQFEKHLKSEGLTTDENKILLLLYSGRPMNFDDLEQSSFFGERRLQDILAAMEQNGLIEREDDRTYRLTEDGVRRRRSIMKHATDLANAQLGVLRPETIGAARLVFTQLLAAGASALNGNAQQGELSCLPDPRK